MTLGEIIRARRKAMDMTQTELADRAGMSQVGISLIERGRKNPSLGTLDVLAAHLKSSVCSKVQAGASGAGNQRGYPVPQVCGIQAG